MTVRVCACDECVWVRWLLVREREMIGHHFWNGCLFREVSLRSGGLLAAMPSVPKDGMCVGVAWLAFWLCLTKGA